MNAVKAECFRKQEYKFSALTGNISQARKFAAKVASTCNFTDQDIFDIKLAVGEAVANAIEHGSPLGESNEINIICHCHGDNFIVGIRDQGKFKKKLPINDNDDVNFRGRGILIMLALMDKVSIDESKHGTTVYLQKKYSQP